MTRRRAWASPRRFLLCLGAALLLLGLLGPAGQVAAEGATGRVSGTGGLGVWLKAQPDLAAARVIALPEGTPLTVLAGPRIAGQGRFWAQVSALGTTGWMVGDFLLLDRVAVPADLAPGAWAQVTGTGGANGLRVRAAPDPAQPLLAILPETSRVQVSSGPTTGANGDPWYQVAANGATGWVDGVYLAPADPPAADPATATARGAALVNVALQQLGKKYVWGATGPDTFDCSGLVLYVARAALGVPLPRTTFDQAFAGVHVDRDQLLPGDLVFFANTYAPGITHVGIYLGAGRWVTAENEDTGVVVLSLDSPYWSAHYAGARRIT